jgi:hypothetical protein
MTRELLMQAGGLMKAKNCIEVMTSDSFESDFRVQKTMSGFR